MIDVKNLTKEFVLPKKEPGFKGTLKSLFRNEVVIKTAVQDISFHIPKGEILGFIGGNGAGKSTTIKVMTGILVPTSGRCTVEGIVPYENRQKNAKNIGVVFGQRTQLWWDLPLSETFTILKEIYDIEDKQFIKRMDFFNEVFGLSDFSSSAVRTLSLGQRMRADLACAMLHNPKVLFLDEPTIGLDIVVKEKIRESIKHINKEFGTTVVLTTHDLGDIEELCSRLIIIDKGSLVYDGDIETVKETYGYMRTLKMEVKHIETSKTINVAKDFKLSLDDAKTWIEENSLFVRFNRDKISIPDIVSYVMPKVQVMDISIYETDIEEIIKKIYRKGVNV